MICEACTRNGLIKSALEQSKYSCLTLQFAVTIESDKATDTSSLHSSVCKIISAISTIYPCSPNLLLQI